MNYFAMPASIDEDERVIRAGGLLALGVLTAMYAYANRNETDGTVATAIARKFASKARLERLVGVGLLASTDRGFAIVDFLAVNRSHEWREARRESDRTRKRRVDSERIPSGADAESAGNRCAPDQTRPNQSRLGTGKNDRASSDREGIANPKLQAVIEGFNSRFQRVTGTAPSWGPKQRALAEQLAEHHDLQEILARMDRCFDRREPSFAWRGGVVDLIRFATLFDQLAQPATSFSDAPLWTPPQALDADSSEPLTARTEKAMVRSGLLADRSGMANQ